MKGQLAYGDHLKKKPIYDFLPAKDRTTESKSEMFDPKNPKHRKIYEDYLKRQQTLECYTEENETFEFPTLHYLKRKFGPSFNIDSVLEPRDLAEMYLAAYSHNLPEVDQPLLREKFFEAISGGSDKYATQLIFIRMLKTMQFIEEKDGKFTINNEKFNELPENERTAKLQLARTLSRGSKDCEDITSVYDAAFEAAKSIAIIEKTGRKNESIGSKLEDERFARNFSNATKDLDPEMLERVVESKRELEIESQKLAQGFTRNQEKNGETFEPYYDEDMLTCDYLKKYLQKKALERAQDQSVEAVQE